MSLAQVRPLRIVALLYAALLVAWRPLRDSPIGTWWLYQLIDILEPWLYVPVAPLALIALSRRDVPATVVMGMPVLAFVIEYGPLFRPVPRSDATGRGLRVMTANVRAGNTDVVALGAALTDEQPDVVALQELGPELAAYLTHTFRERYPHQAIVPSSNRQMDNGMGILSRYPITGVVAPQMDPEGCGCQQVKLDMLGQTITVLNVHPAPPLISARKIGPFLVPNKFNPANQEVARRALLERLDAIAPPRLVVGDFNLSERQPFYQLMRRRFGDAYREAGWGLGPTYPNQPIDAIPMFPVVRLDYIFHDVQWTVRRAWTATLRGSDHRYVVADLARR